MTEPKPATDEQVERLATALVEASQSSWKRLSAWCRGELPEVDVAKTTSRLRASLSKLRSHLTPEALSERAPQLATQLQKSTPRGNQKFVDDLFGVVDETLGNANPQKALQELVQGWHPRLMQQLLVIIPAVESMATASHPTITMETHGYTLSPNQRARLESIYELDRQRIRSGLREFTRRIAEQPLFDVLTFLDAVVEDLKEETARQATLIGVLA